MAEAAQIYVDPSERFKRALYQSTIDMLYDTFGEDRVLFGSDYPNSNILGPFKDVIDFELHLLVDKSEAQRRKFYSANAARIYRFKARQPDQG
ncbi:hypothetical protein AA103196_2615 [Ameyamaea chiangmaiensis NBRC 103196]|nr:hypothetical protein AA103196_2615 [Ameyamaea chiangmaiensis NBRC 103196]